MRVKENVILEFRPEQFEITEGEDGKMRLGGVALTVGESKNRRHYTEENLKENDGRHFKWLYGHPKSEVIEENIVGKGNLTFKEGKLLHEGFIMNTARRPDVIKQVKEQLLQPSIHATARKITEKEGSYEIEGLNIGGIGLVGFQGVKDASIDYAIAESFNDEAELKESEQKDEENKDKEESNMDEEPKKEEPMPEDKVEEKPEEKPQESVSMAEYLKLKEALVAEKSKGKVALVESILELNKDLKKEVLMEKEETELKVIKEYEMKLAKTSTPEAGVVEHDDDKKPEVIVEGEDGTVSLSEAAYRDFNREIRERIL